MTKAELVKVVADKTRIAQVGAVETVDAVIGAIADALKRGETVKLHGLGTFKVKDRLARKGRNPKNGEEIMIPASKKVAFSTAKELKEALQ